MRFGLLAFFFVCALTPVGANAQSTITLSADPVPIVDAEINGRPVRLEVDLRFPRGIALSAAAGERLHVRRVPFVAIAIGIEGSDATIRGRIARPRVVFDGREATRAFAGLFPAPVSTRADGVIGPGVLPYDLITITLGPEPAAARDIVLPLDDADDWHARANVGGRSVLVGVNPGIGASVFNRPAAWMYDESGAIPASGELAQTPLILGLSTLMQPVETDLALEGLPLGSAFARTNAPLLGASEPDAIIVRAEAHDPPPPSITLGREALASCAYIRVDRRTKRLTLHCAA